MIISLYFVLFLFGFGVRTLPIIPQAVNDHYWRDFNGLVPTDAIPGGKLENGAITFMAQITVRAEYNAHISAYHIVPGSIVPGSDEAIAAYQERTFSTNTTGNNIKVLCGTSSRYKWYKKTAQFPTNCRFVVGGYEDQVPMYIGRANIGREVITGKIFADTNHHTSGLVVPYNGVTYPESYEILTYCY